MTDTILVPDVPFTRALVDGSVRVDGFDVGFDAGGGSSPELSARLRGRIPPDVAGGEQVIPDYLVRLARRVGQPLTALPVFLTRGMVHRKLVARRGSRSLTSLVGARVGMSRFLAATAVYLRGFLADPPYNLQRGAAGWVAAEPFTSDDALASDWPFLHERLGTRAPDLLDLLVRGELDLVLYPGGGGGNLFYWVEAETGAPSGHGASHYGDLESLVAGQPELCFPVGSVAEIAAWFQRKGVYPLFHLVAVHTEIMDRSPGLMAALLDAFAQASRRAPTYLNEHERLLYDREMELLGVDPNEVGLTPLARRSVEYVLATLAEDGVLPRALSLDEVFSVAGGGGGR